MLKEAGRSQHLSLSSRVIVMLKQIYCVSYWDDSYYEIMVNINDRLHGSVV